MKTQQKNDAATISRAHWELETTNEKKKSIVKDKIFRTSWSVETLYIFLKCTFNS